METVQGYGEISNKLYHYKAIVKKVKDGDTISIELDLGMNTWLKDDVRFARINAYETKMTKGTTAEMKAAGLEGKTYLASIIEGKEVIVKTAFDKQVREKFGRLLVEVFYKKEDGQWINLNDEMVKLNYAIYKNY